MIVAAPWGVSLHVIRLNSFIFLPQSAFASTKIQEFANITESSMFSALCQMLKTKEIKNQQLDAFAQGIKSWQDQLHTKSLQQEVMAKQEKTLQKMFPS